MKNTINNSIIYSLFFVIFISSFSFQNVYSKSNPSETILNQVESKHTLGKSISTICNEMSAYCNNQQSINSDPFSVSFYREIKIFFTNHENDTNYILFYNSLKNKLQTITQRITSQIPNYDNLVGNECAQTSDCKNTDEKCIDIAEYNFSKPGKNGASCTTGSHCKSGYCHPNQNICTSQKRCLKPINLNYACDPFSASKSYCGSNAKCMNPDKYLNDPMGINWFISFAGSARIIKNSNVKKLEISSCAANGARCQLNTDCCSSSCVNKVCECLKKDSKGVCLDNKACTPDGKTPPNNDYTLCCDQYMENSVCKKRCYTSGQKPPGGNQSDCCSGLIDNITLSCKTKYLCLDCVELKQRTRPGQRCCEGLTLINGKCEYKEIIPLNPRVSYTKKILNAVGSFLSSLFISKAHANDGINPETCEMKITPILTTQHEVFFNALTFLAENNNGIDDYWGINKDLTGIAKAFKKIRTELIAQGESNKNNFYQKCQQLATEKTGSDQILFYNYLIEFHQSLKKLRQDSLVKYKDLENKNSDYIKNNSPSGNSLKELYERIHAQYSPITEYMTRHHTKYLNDTFLASHYRNNFPDLWWNFIPWVESKRTETSSCKVTWNSFWFDYYGSDQTWNYYYLPHAARNNNDLKLFSSLFEKLSQKNRFYTQMKKHNCGFLNVGRKIEKNIKKYYPAKNPICNERIPNSYCIKEVYEIDGLDSKNGLFLLDPLIPAITPVSKPSNLRNFATIASSLVIKESYVPEFTQYDNNFSAPQHCNTDPFSINDSNQRPLNPTDTKHDSNNNPPFHSESCNQNNYNTSYQSPRTIPISSAFFNELHEEAKKYSLSNDVKLFHPESLNALEHSENFAKYVIDMHFLYPKVTAHVEYPTSGLLSYIQFAYELIRSINLSNINNDTIIRGLNLRIAQLEEVRQKVQNNNKLITNHQQADKILDKNSKIVSGDHNALNPMISIRKFDLSQIDMGILQNPSKSNEKLSKLNNKSFSESQSNKQARKKITSNFLNKSNRSDSNKFKGRNLKDLMNEFNNNPRAAKLLNQQKQIYSMLSGKPFFSKTSESPLFYDLYNNKKQPSISNLNKKDPKKKDNQHSLNAQHSLNGFVFQNDYNSDSNINNLRKIKKQGRDKLQRNLKDINKNNHFDTLFKKITRAYHKIALPRLFIKSSK